MIPPVEERQVRPCSECCFSWSDDYLDKWCNLSIQYAPDCEYRKEPCIYHYTTDEMKELIDSWVIP